MKELNQITVIGLGLLGGSIGLTIRRCFPKAKVIGHTHRQTTRKKARKAEIVDEVCDRLEESVSNSELVILATPVCTFENIFSEIADALPKGCIVTDVGSTKVLAHKWAEKTLPGNTQYIGSHPIAGSEQRGLEFARDDLFEKAICILTTKPNTKRNDLQTLKNFWAKLGCLVKTMTPEKHDKVFADISHIPHITAASLVNANDSKTLKFAGKGFIDTSRIASGPPNIWSDIIITNAQNNVKGIDKIIKGLKNIKNAIKNNDKKQIEELLKNARRKRAVLINYKMKQRELLP